MKVENYIEKFNPCLESQDCLRQFNTTQEAWNACQRGDWMLSMAGLLKIDKRLIVGAAGRCAATVKHLATDERSLAALDACEKFMRGEIGEAELGAAADAARVARVAADAARVARVARVAAYAAADARAAAADAAADARAAAAYAAAAYAAADARAAAAYAAAAYAAAAAARAENRRQTADICRELLTEAVFVALEAAERGEG